MFIFVNVLVICFLCIKVHKCKSITGLLNAYKLAIILLDGDDMKKTAPTTEALKNRLLQSDSIDEFIDLHHKDISYDTFSEYLYSLIKQRGIKISEAFHMAQMSESYGYQLINGKRQPSRDKVVQLAIGLDLSLSETNRLLKLSGKSELYVKDQRDAVFMFSINKKWNLFDVEALLLERKLENLIKK